MRQGGGRNMFCFSPSQVPILHPVVLDPDLAQDLDCRDFSEPGGSQRITHRGEDFPGRPLQSLWPQRVDLPPMWASDSLRCDAHSDGSTRHHSAPKANQAPPQPGCSRAKRRAFATHMCLFIARMRGQDMRLRRCTGVPAL